ncbi:hypothetical protein LOD99_4748 [Oopsacas minuta]|uniref:Uncharacterized protein n=1 Tax=Oopsacas minuta TaxID=111878 RepID=A0AAV7JSL6_9METZ|nr:hypothetical protein LOD99_4748 [Oopsacas minuta]
MYTIFTGRGGAACQCCFAGQTDVSDPDVVIAGFPLNCTLQAIKDTVVELTSDGKEHTAYPSRQRAGITHEPASSIEVFPKHPYTHTYVYFIGF